MNFFLDPIPADPRMSEEVFWGEGRMARKLVAGREGAIHH